MNRTDREVLCIRRTNRPNRFMLGFKRVRYLFAREVVEFAREVVEKD